MMWKNIINFAVSGNICHSVSPKHCIAAGTAGLITAISTGVAGVAGAAASVASTSMTNSTNKSLANVANRLQYKMHKETQEFNSEEAEKAREFNAEQAQITRDWMSEESVMQRRKDAGVNMINPGDIQASGSPSPASGSPATSPSAPSVHVPQMQPYDIGGIIESAIDLAKAPSEIGKTKADTDKSLEDINKIKTEADLINTQANHQRIVNEYTPEQLESLISSQTAQGLNHFEQALNQPLVRSQIESTITRIKNDVFNACLDGILKIQGSQLDVETAIRDTDLEYSKLANQGEMYARSLEKSILDGSFQFGDKIVHGKQQGTVFHKGDIHRHGYNLGGSLSGSGTPQFAKSFSFMPKGKPGKGGFIPPMSLNGGYSGSHLDITEDYNTRDTTSMGTRDATYYYKNTLYEEYGSKLLGTVNLIQRSENAKVIFESMHNLKNLYHSARIYFELQELFNTKQEIQKQGNTIPTLPFD